MNIQVGAGGVRLPGFLNVDVRKVPGVDIVGDASDLHTIKDRTVDVVFGHAVFEHFFLGQQIGALREWKRILTPSGVIIVLGLPDFAVIADLYVKCAAGIVGDRFDLHNVYRYSHGEPEHATQPVWKTWRATNGAAPDGWIPQLHKSLFDPSYLRDLLAECDLRGAIFNYAYPGEDHALCLGFIATADGIPPADIFGLLSTLEKVPDLGRFVNTESLAMSDATKPRDSLVNYAKNLAAAEPQTFSKKVAKAASRWLRGFTLAS